MAGKGRTRKEIELIFKEHGYKFIYDYYCELGYRTRRAIVVDSNGYRYNVNIKTFIRGNSPRFADKKNMNTLDNISLWMKINNKTFYLHVDNVYIGLYGKLKVICLVCDEMFYSDWGKIKRGYGCAVCAGKQVGKKTSLAYLRPHLAREWHEKNEISPYSVTVFSSKRIWWKCLEGHEWEALVSKRETRGCPFCSGFLVSDKNRLSVINPDLAEEWHLTKNGKLTPHDVSYGSYKKVWWFCKKCKNEWKTTIDNRGSNGRGCPSCKARISKGEGRVINFLSDNNILFFREYKFENCKSKIPLPFDFYLPDHNLCTEYNGIQHYESVDFFGGEESFKSRQYRDQIKIDYCKSNDINLLIIPYWDFENIENILKEELNL